MSEILNNAKKRIKEVRQRNVEIIVRKNGVPVENAGVSVRMKKHDFLFGAICYKYGTYENEEMNETFTREFKKLFNYTMIPYHWGSYEPRYREYNEPYTSNLIKWAKENDIKRKLHALIWHEVCPKWLTYEDDVKERYTERITYLMEKHGDDFNFFDLANETTVNDRFVNPVSKWVREFGPMNMLKFGTELVRSIKPDAKLLYGDWNVHVQEYYDFLAEMRENDIDIDIVGVQSHMHVDRWPQEETMEIMDKASSYGWPLHFPECSVNSGSPVGKTDYSPGGKNYWIEKEEDLYDQAEFTKEFYNLVFSHHSVEALSWFDFTDHHWLNAPSGVVTDKLKIKPVYNTLYDLIHKEWHSDEDLTTGSEGNCKTRLFFGEYDITVDVDSQPKTFQHSIKRTSFYQGDNDMAAHRIVIDL